MSKIIRCKNGCEDCPFYQDNACLMGFKDEVRRMRKIRPTIDPFRVKDEIKAGYLKAYVEKDGSIMITSTITGDCVKIGEVTSGKEESEE